MALCKDIYIGLGKYVDDMLVTTRMFELESRVVESARKRRRELS